MTAADVAFLARKAADEVERRGLAHATLADYTNFSALDDCKVCVLGALGAAYWGDPLAGYDVIGEKAEGYVELLNAVMEHLGLTPPAQGAAFYAPLYEWNDRQAEDPATRDLYRVRTTEEVAKVLRDVADAVEAAA